MLISILLLLIVVAGIGSLAVMFLINIDAGIASLVKYAAEQGERDAEHARRRAILSSGEGIKLLQQRLADKIAERQTPA